jgi:hypothetical protein
VVQSERTGLFSITVPGENTTTPAVGLDGGSAVAFGAAGTPRIPALAAVKAASRKIVACKMVVPGFRLNLVDSSEAALSCVPHVKFSGISSNSYTFLGEQIPSSQSSGAAGPSRFLAAKSRKGEVGR